MADFLFSNYLGLEKDQLVCVQLKDNKEVFIGRIVSVGGVQAYQPAFTPDNAADLQVIKDFKDYKVDKNKLDNFYHKRLYRADVESISIVSIHDLLSVVSVDTNVK